MDQTRYVDKEGLKLFGEQIAAHIKNKINSIPSIRPDLSNYVQKPDFEEVTTNINSELERLNNLLDKKLDKPLNDMYVTDSKLVNILSRYILKDDYNTLRNQVSQNSNRINNLTSNITELKSKIQTINSNIYSLNAKIIEHDNNLLELIERTSLFTTRDEIEHIINSKVDIEEVNDINESINDINIRLSYLQESSNEGTSRDLNNIYWWWNTLRDNLYLHNGKRILDSQIEKQRFQRYMFMPGSIYKRKDKTINIRQHHLEIEYNVTTNEGSFNGIFLTNSRDHNTTLPFLQYIERVKNYEANLNLTNQGLITNTNEIIINTSIWNQLIDDAFQWKYTDHKDKIKIEDVFISGIIKFSILPIEVHTFTSPYFEDLEVTTNPSTLYFQWSFTTNDPTSNIPINGKEIRIFCNVDQTHLPSNDMNVNNTLIRICQKRGNVGTNTDSQMLIPTETTLINNVPYVHWGMLNPVDGIKRDDIIDMLKYFNIEDAYINNQYVFFTIKDISDDTAHVITRNDVDDHGISYEEYIHSLIDSIYTGYTTIKCKNDYSVYYNYEDIYIKAGDYFEDLSSSNCIRSIDGQTGNISFANSNEPGSVTFTLNNGQLGGIVAGDFNLQANPTGSILMWPSPIAPAGYKLCDGSEFAEGSYTELENVLGSRTLPNLSHLITNIYFIIKV